MTFWRRSASATSFSVGRAVMRARMASSVDMCAGVCAARMMFSSPVRYKTLFFVILVSFVLGNSAVRRSQDSLLAPDED